ncbi:hypothetical protein NLJ89_g10844 [Agrocybe chaxingu]|uniref:Uncharacterized protein n=1 Tax=Agrocybe chaxingu TaxID=84603 RepID=A0A9W8JR18_9AGAR|nr:hypothetical protein NLJ89_g10844 [Agrocybe chaxingu]
MASSDSDYDPRGDHHLAQSHHSSRKCRASSKEAEHTDKKTRVGHPRQSAEIGKEKISQHYKPGGMLDSQIDSQTYVNSLGGPAQDAEQNLSGGNDESTTEPESEPEMRYQMKEMEILFKKLRACQETMFAERKKIKSEMESMRAEIEGLRKVMASFTELL